MTRAMMPKGADKQPWIEKLMAVWVGRHVVQP